MTLVYGFDTDIATANPTKQDNIPVPPSESSSSIHPSPSPTKVTSKLKAELMAYQKLRNDEVLDKLLPKIYKVTWNVQ